MVEDDAFSSISLFHADKGGFSPDPHATFFQRFGERRGHVEVNLLEQLRSR